MLRRWQTHRSLQLLAFWVAQLELSMFPLSTRYKSAHHCVGKLVTRGPWACNWHIRHCVYILVSHELPLQDIPTCSCQLQTLFANSVWHRKRIGLTKATKIYSKMFRFRNGRITNLFNWKNYKVSVSVGNATKDMYTGNCVLETSAVPNIVRNNSLNQNWNRMIVPGNAPALRKESIETICVHRITNLHVQMVCCQLRVNVCTIPGLVVAILLRRAFINRLVERLFNARGEPVSQSSIPKLIGTLLFLHLKKSAK